jgi:hypothetical protein
VDARFYCRLLKEDGRVKNRYHPTKRAPDAGDSAAISGSFLRLIIFLVGRLRRPCPSAGNANRWHAPCIGKYQRDANREYFIRFC